MYGHSRSGARCSSCLGFFFWSTLSSARRIADGGRFWPARNPSLPSFVRAPPLGPYQGSAHETRFSDGFPRRATLHCAESEGRSRKANLSSPVFQRRTEALHPSD